MRPIFSPFGDELPGDEFLLQHLLQAGEPFIGFDLEKKGIVPAGSEESEAFHPQGEGGGINPIEDRIKHVQVLLFHFTDEGEGEVIVFLANRLPFDDIRIDRSA